MARFFLLFTTGQNTAFSIPFSKIGLLLKMVKTVIRTMAASGAFSSEEVAEGLADLSRSRESKAPGMRTRATSSLGLRLPTAEFLRSD